MVSACLSRLAPRPAGLCCSVCPYVYPTHPVCLCLCLWPCIYMFYSMLRFQLWLLTPKCIKVWSITITIVKKVFWRCCHQNLKANVSIGSTSFEQSQLTKGQQKNISIDFVFYFSWLLMKVWLCVGNITFDLLWSNDYHYCNSCLYCKVLVSSAGALKYYNKLRFECNNEKAIIVLGPVNNLSYHQKQNRCDWQSWSNFGLKKIDLPKHLPVHTCSYLREEIET